MALYGSFKYGTADKYGVDVGADLLAWGIEVDWDGDGAFSGTPEPYPIDLKIERGRQFAVKSDGNGFEPVTTGKLTFRLDNSSGRYDPFNASSPLYPNVAPGKRVVARVRDMGSASGAVYYLFTGEVTDIKPESSDGGDQVSISATECQKLLIDRTPIVALGTTMDVEIAMANILRSADWIYGESIDTGSDSIPYFWNTAINCWKLLQEIADTFLGKLFIAADGSVKYYSRSRAITSVLSLAENDIGRNVIIRQPWECIRNRILWTVTPRTLQSITAVWALTTKPALTAGEVVTYWVNYKYLTESVPCTGMVWPVATTDYTANTAADGSGSDRTSVLQVVPYFFAEIARIEITNTGADTLYVTKLQIRGNPLSADEAVTFEKTDATSIATYHERELRMDGLFQQDLNQGDSFADALKLEFSTAKKWPEFSIVHRWDLQFIPDLFDAITLSFPTKDVDGEFWATRIIHEWQSPTGQDVKTTIQTEPVVNYSAYWKFPATLGITSIFGV